MIFIGSHLRQSLPAATSFINNLKMNTAHIVMLFGPITFKPIKKYQLKPKIHKHFFSFGGEYVYVFKKYPKVYINQL